MKNLIFLTLLILPLFSVNAQIISGQYSDQLKLAYNPTKKLITGYFEAYSGYDEETGNAQFSCIFYLKGKLDNNTAKITSYYPLSKENDQVSGTLKIKNDSLITLHLTEEHGGCWNVQHFADEAVELELTKKNNWKEIRHITSERSYFYSEKTEASKRKAYVVKGDIIYIDQIDGEWVHCKYQNTIGWIKTATLNKL